MARLKRLGLNHTNVVFSNETVSGSVSGIEDPLPPIAPPQLHVRRFGAAAFAAAFFVFVLTFSHGAVAGDAGRQSGNQARLEAEYVVSVAGIPIGRGNWIIEISDESYSAAASGTTTGIIRFFTGGRGTGAARGTFSAGQPVPTNYGATLSYDRKIDDVRMTLTAGNVTDYVVEPPLPAIPDRIPITDADRRGVLDPMTSMLNRVSGSGDPVSPEACNRKVAVFDGRVRYDLHSEFRRIAGYVPDRPAIKYLVALRDAEVWLAPIAGTRVLVPFRFAMPTPLGIGLLRATEFISVAQPLLPSHPMAKTQ
jgi:hypothetical protein